MPGPQQIMPTPPDRVNLGDGDWMSMDDFAKLPRDVQDAYKTKGDATDPNKIHLPFGMGNYTDYYKQFAQEHPTINRGVGALAGAAGSWEGGLPGMAMGGVIGAAVPPSDTTDLMTTLAGGALTKGYKYANSLETLAQRTLARGAVGAGQGALNSGVRALVGEGDPKDLVGLTSSTVMPMLMGALGDKAVPAIQKSKLTDQIQQSYQKLQGKFPDSAGNTTSNTVANIQDAFDKYHAAQQAQPAAKAAYDDALKAQIDKLAQINGPEDGTMDYLKARRAQMNAAKYSQTRTPEDDQIEAINKGIDDELKAGASGKNPDAVNFNVQLMKRQLAAVQDQKYSRISDMIDSAAFSKATEQLTNNGKTYEALGDTFKKLQDVTSNMELPENVSLRKLIPPSGGKDPVESFVQNIGSTNVSGEDIKALYGYLGNLPDGQKRISDIQNILINRFFTEAYDPKAKAFVNAPKLFQADGNFNLTKLTEIFGGGREGQQTANQFSQTVSDLNKVNQIHQQQQQNMVTAKGSKNDPLTRFFYHWGPAGLLVEIGRTAGGALAGYKGAAIGAGLGGATGLAIVKGPALVQAALQNPKMAAAIHELGTSGVINATLSNFIKQKGYTYDGPAPQPPPQPQRGQGQPQGQPPQPQQLMQQPQGQ